MRKLSYYIRVALNNMTQNLFTNIVSIVTLSLSLLILSVFILLYINLESLVRSAAQDLSVSVYLKDDLDSNDLKSLQTQIAGLSQVKGITYVSKSQALADLKLRLGEKSSLLDGLKKNPLPASFELRLKSEVSGDKDQINALISGLGKMMGVEDIDYAWEWAESLSGLFNFLKLSGLVVGSLLFLATVFIISNTIKLTIYSRRDEIYTMRLIGAAEGFIRAPFFIEGFLQGLAGGLISLAALFLVFKLAVTQIQLPFGLSMVNPTFLSPSAACALVGTGIFLGVLGSLISLGRFMSL